MRGLLNLKKRPKIRIAKMRFTFYSAIVVAAMSAQAHAVLTDYDYDEEDMQLVELEATPEFDQQYALAEIGIE